MYLDVSPELCRERLQRTGPTRRSKGLMWMSLNQGTTHVDDCFRVQFEHMA
jgi:hypothetical protein